MTNTTANDIARLESTRQAVQERIDSRRSAAERNRIGQFATPNSLAVEIARDVLALADESHKCFSFAEPSVGTGSFYSAALTVFGRDRLTSAVGVEIDPAFADAARELWAGHGLQVVETDFTRMLTDRKCPPPPNLILANPPYVRHHHLNRDDKEWLKRITFERAGVEVNGLAGLYVYFLLLATAWMEEGGHAAWLIPSEFMDVNYGAALKRFLCNRVTLVRVHRFDPEQVQFNDALVSSVVVTIRKSHPPQDHQVRFTFGGMIAEPAACQRVPVDALREARKWTVYPCHDQNDRRLSGEASGIVLGNLFRIRRGIATGCNEFFVLNRNDAHHRGLPDEFLRPILPSPRQLKSTVIESGGDGYPKLDPQLSVIDCDVNENELQRKHPALWKYLETAESLGIKDRYLVSKRVPWYRQEQRSPAPFLCTYMGRGKDERRPFRFIWNHSRAIGTNLYLMLYPLAVLDAMLRQYPERAADVFDLLCRVTGHELRGEGRVYGGGLHKIEPSELARISATAFLDKWPELATVVARMKTPSLFDNS